MGEAAEMMLLHGDDPGVLIPKHMRYRRPLERFRNKENRRTMTDIQDAIAKITEGLTELAEALGGEGSTEHTEESLAALDRDALVAAAEAAGVEVKKGQKAKTIIAAILAAQDSDDDDDDEDEEEEKPKKGKGKKDSKSSKGSKKSEKSKGKDRKEAAKKGKSKGRK